MREERFAQKRMNLRPRGFADADLGFEAGSVGGEIGCLDAGREAAAGGERRGNQYDDQA